MDIFEHQYRQLSEREAPLAARMRPRTLDEFFGQEAIIGPGRLLRRAIQADQLSSIIFYGPPGTGKTTLAQIIANTTQAHFVAMNAVLAGIKDIREAVETAKARRGQHGQRTILFVDEVHRFNKAQQDALLPWVENGTLTLIGATTENPYFEVNKALVSRSRLFQLKSLTPDDLKQVLAQAIADPVRGYGSYSIEIAETAIAHWTNIANGDARTLLNALELAVETTPPDAAGSIQIDLAVAEASIQKRAVLYDKEGDAHFDTISAFIKSVRGSDPDAALYWLARMIYAGEDPKFIFRRMVILASEDVGLADPQAVVIVNACAQAFDRVGLPEGQYPLAQATLYLATAPKSNRVLGYFDALAAVEKEGSAEVPNPLKDDSRDRDSFGHGKGYAYPHAYKEHWVAQQYLPTSLQGKAFYQPSDQGYEGQIRDRIARQREAQIASFSEELGFAAEILSHSPKEPAQERWLQRTVSQAGQYLAQVREGIFLRSSLQRHHLVLDLNASSGLLTWEALRQVPEGGVYARVPTAAAAEQLQSQAEALPPLNRPQILQGELNHLQDVLHQQAPDVQFDWILGRNALSDADNKIAIAEQLKQILAAQGRVVFAERLPKNSQRLYEWLSSTQTGKLYDRWQSAEELIYDLEDGDALLNWSIEDWLQPFQDAGFRVKTESETIYQDVYITPRLLERWFSEGMLPCSYGDHLRKRLSKKEVQAVYSLMSEHLLHRTLPWRSAIFYITAGLV
ncbi:MAG: AAA family ATPase [Thermosynechococcaceae cyanobacterium MS004]|nr:AAA family ATPase [Thermosynechococcaceae cyanobacterium MS004]